MLRMEEGAAVRLIIQFLHEHNFTRSLKELEKESGRIFVADDATLKTGELQEILDDYALKEKQRELEESSVNHWFSPGNQEYVTELWCSLDGLFDGVNLLVVNLTENGVLTFGGAKAQLGTLELPLPFVHESPPIPSIPDMCNVGKAAVLCLDPHPTKKRVILCGSMDRHAYILDMEREKGDKLVQSFCHHSKYVVRAVWAPSGRFFVTGSYDHSFCVYRLCDGNEEEFELLEKLEMNGAVEGVSFAKDRDEVVIGVRSDHRLHCYDLSSGKLVESRTINLNKLEDTFVSFVPMHISFSPDGKFLLVSSDKNRLILFSWETGKQIANFYGATNDELTQPRHCWDPSGKYIYGTSQDSIYVWEIRSQKLVSRLNGHTRTVRNLHFCKELEILVSCGFDGTIKLWKRPPSP